MALQGGMKMRHCNEMGKCDVARKSENVRFQGKGKM